MYTAEDYYDLEDNLLIDDLLEDDLLEDDYYEDDLLEDDLLEDDIFNEDYDLPDDVFDEDFTERRRRGRRSRRRGSIKPRYPRGARKKSNFGKSVTSRRKGNYVSKAEFKKSLNAISRDVNTIKKTALINGKTIKALDGKYADVVKEIARKDKNQTKVLKNMQTMSMLGSLLNKPKFDEANLEVRSGENGTPDTIIEKQDNKTVKYDQTLSLLLPMLTTMGDPGTGKSSSNDMMLPLVLLMTQKEDSGDDNLLPLILLMTMNK